METREVGKSQSHHLVLIVNSHLMRYAFLKAMDAAIEAGGEDVVEAEDGCAQVCNARPGGVGVV